MAFKVGDRVVYPHHGAAVIKKKEAREVNGEKVDYFVLHMAHGDLTLSVPIDKGWSGKLSYSKGTAVRVGGDYSIYNVALQYRWFD